VSTAPALKHTTTAFGSKAERKINVQGTLARNSQEMQWDQMGSTRAGSMATKDGSHLQPPSTALSPSNSNRRSLVTGAPSQGNHIVLSAEQGIVRVNKNAVQLRSYANAVSKQEGMPAMGKGDEKKKPIFSPRQISDKIVPDVDFQVFSPKSSYRPKKVESDSQCKSPVLGQSTLQSGVHLWSYVVSKDDHFWTGMSEDEVNRQFARRILQERSFNERQKEESLRHKASLLDCEVKGLTTLLEKRAPETPRRLSKQQNVDLHDFLTLEVSPKRDETIDGRNNARADMPLEDPKDDTHQATAELGKNETNKLLPPTTSLQHVRPYWRLSREYTASPRRSTVMEINELPYISESSVSLESQLSAPVPPKKVAFCTTVEPKSAEEKGQPQEVAAHQEPMELHASSFGGRMRSPKQPKHSGAGVAGLVDVAILSRAHFALEYMADSNILRLQHVDRAGSIGLWTGKLAC